MPATGALSHGIGTFEVSRAVTAEITAEKALAYQVLHDELRDDDDARLVGERIVRAVDPPSIEGDRALSCEGIETSHQLDALPASEESFGPMRAVTRVT